MSILVNKNSKVIVQGITGKEGSFHTQQMIEYGTNIVAGVVPNKGGLTHLDKPIFNTVHDVLKSIDANTSVIFVPSAFAADSIMEAADAGIKTIICITEGIPIQDMIKVKAFLENKNSVLIGPNCPGIITPDEAKIGIMPGFIHKKGCVGIVSRSGTLTYEAVHQTTKVGLGQSTCIGIGGDPIIGSSMRKIIEMLMHDDETKAIVMIGEIGGDMEIESAEWIRDNSTKPVIGFIAGKTAPKGKTMGHAGAIVGGKSDTAQAKIEIMKSCGIIISDSPADIGKITYNSIIK